MGRSDKITALKEAFYRQTAPNITSLFATAARPKDTVDSYGLQLAFTVAHAEILVFFFVIYFQGQECATHPQSSSMRVDVSAYHSAGFRVDLAVKNQRVAWLKYNCGTHLQEFLQSLPFLARSEARWARIRSSFSTPPTSRLFCRRHCEETPLCIVQNYLAPNQWSCLVALQTALVSNLYFFSQCLGCILVWPRFNGRFCAEAALQALQGLFLDAAVVVTANARQSLY